ncbi:NUDIX domain-containing protein [Adhaeribacter pallidiroseus]|uniref:GDP-mannose pyrophosphatase n=1 Tax=Adhaeribacter pallidiroseus TaxID=2072847 RepID=A0A369QB82_9BACT|nr:NUDIX hydrolase [Adhaeribacter pallidiroseus]RDC61580.1 ADP-ribose diphosphatase [Adhaeribacter pallidiroseus]
MKIIDKQIAYDGFFKLYKVKLEDAGKILERELFDTGQAVAALVFDTARQKYIFVKQYRLANNSKVLEVVAGLHDKPSESLEEAACREVEEETGYAIDQIIPIAAYYSSPGAFAEKINLFYAEVSQKKSEGGGLAEEHENIEIVEVAPLDLATLPIEDGKTLIAVQWALLRNK